MQQNYIISENGISFAEEESFNLPEVYSLEDSVSLEARYEQVYRKQGIRFYARMLDPKLHPVTELEEIDFSVLHYMIPGQSKETFGISSDNPFIKDKKKKVAVYHQLDYPKNIKGPTKKRFYNSRLAMRAYHKLNPTLFWVRTEKKLNMFWTRRPWNMICDYSLMGRSIIFRNGIMKHLFEFEAQYSGYLNGISEFLKLGNRRQLMMFHVPDTLPKIMELRLASKEFKKTYWKAFPSYTQLALLDMWKWLDPHTRKESIMDKYFTERNYDSVDILFHYKGHVALLNMGLLNKWLTGKEPLDGEETEEEKSVEGEEGISQSQARRFQKRFYLFLSKIIEKQKEYESKMITVSDEKQATDVEQVYNTNTDDSLKDDDIPDTDDPDLIKDNGEIEIIHNQQKDNEYESEKLEGEDSLQSGSEEGSRRSEGSSDQGSEETTPSESGGEDPEEQEHRLAREIAEHSQANSIFGQRTNSFEPVLPEQDRVRKPLKSTSSLIDIGSRKQLDELSYDLELTQRETDFWDKQLKAYQKIKNPFDTSGKQSLEDFVNQELNQEINKEDITIPDIPLVMDKSMLESTLINYDKHYIEKSLKRDIARNILAVQKAGVAVTDYRVEKKKDIASDFEIHVIQFTPIGGSPSTIRMKLPVLDDNGVITSSGVQYRYKRLRVDRSLRKVNENKVSLTSFYGKIFANRCTRRKYNLDDWVLSQLELKVLSDEYKNVEYGEVITKIRSLPSVIRGIISRYSSFTIAKHKVTLDFVNMTQTGDIIEFCPEVTFDTKLNKWYLNDKPISQDELFGFDINEGPDSYAELKILGEAFPIGFVLARQLGFSTLVEKLNLYPEKYESGKHVEKEPHHLMVRFADEKWIFDKRILTESQKLIISGINAYSKDIKKFPRDEFERKDVYGSILNENGVPTRYEKELDLMDAMFIDDRTREILTYMNEPTDLNELYIRMAELLTSSHHVDEINMDDMLIQGNERIAGAVYKNIVTAMRQLKSKSITTKRRFEMKPDDVWLTIAKDPSLEIVDDINPIVNLKEQEIVTYIGEGGRSKRSMVKHTRSYHDTDLGVISEATVDSFDVGINIYTSANPQFDTYLGTTKRVDITDKNLSIAKINSTTANLTPFGDNDDSKRRLFSSVQASHRIPIKGAMVSPLRTGYENVVAHRVDDKFAYTAKQDGVIKDKTPKYIVVQYKDGTEVQIETGLRIASSKGNYYKHELVCDLDKGFKFKVGHVLVFNNAFFRRDMLNLTQVIQCDRTFARTMLIESNDTFEDSSAISSKISGMLETTTVKQKTIVVNAGDRLINMVRPGQEVDIDTELVIIDDAIFSDKTHFDNASTDILKRLSKISPKAGIKGKILKVEAFYFCEEDELSPSIKEIVSQVIKDKFSGTKTHISDKRAMSGKIDEPLKFGSNLIGKGQVGIRVYIEGNLGMSAGDY